MVYSINGLFPGTLQPDEKLAGCIEIFENVWPDTQETIRLIEEECANQYSGVNWEMATTIGKGIHQSERTNFHLGVTHLASITNNQLLQNIHNQMYVTLLAATVPYSKRYNIDEMYHEPYNLLRYEGGQEYKNHFDGNTDTGRSISAVLYLNNDYVGGEIEFVNFGIKISPEPGMLILFPSNFAYSHIAHPVTDGTKYAIVTWIKDRQI